MKRNWKLMLCLLVALFALSACSSQPDPEDFPDITQALGPTGTPAPAADLYEENFDDSYIEDMQLAEMNAGEESIFDVNPYDDAMMGADALMEENYVDPEYGVEETYTFDMSIGTDYVYAGSTPIPLNPIDMPTPTPRPDLSFTYAAYTASTVGVTFEGPVNWQVDQSQPGMLILAEPQNQVKDNWQCVVTLSAEPVTSNYSQKDLKSHVTQRLNTIGGSEFTEWEPSYTATRYMMGSEGVYANYSGMLSDGTEVGGRIHYVCIDRTLYGVEITFPLGYKDDFLDVFGKIRSTIGRIQ